MTTDAKELETASQVSPFQSWKNKLQVLASSQLLMWLGLTCLFSAIPLYYIKHAVLNDPDIWWHMRAGEWMFQNHRIPHVDPFSTSTLGRQWVDYCWMFDAAVYWVVKQFDLVSIVWCQTIMRLAVTAALFSLLRSLTSFWKAVALTGLGMLAMAWSLPPRPGAFSVLFFVIELHVLVSAQRKSNLRLLWILPGLFLLWANIHIEFVNGLFVLGVFSIEPFLDRLFAGSRGPRTTLDAFRRQLLIVCGASFLAVLVNPYGIKLLTTMLELAGGGKIYDVILEFQAMFFRTINDWAVLSMLMLGCFALGRARAFRSAWGVLLAWSAWMGFRSLREVWLVTILSAVVAASYISEEEESPVEKRDTGMAMRLAVAAAVIVVLLAGASAWSLSSRGLLRQVTETYPVGAVNYIHRNHLQGPLLNEFSWGGFLIYALPEIPVSMDGRANVHTEEEIVRSLPLWNGEPGWENHPEVQRANLIISNHTWALASLLRSDPRFRVVYEDHTSVLFEAVHTEKTGAQAMSPSR